MNFSSKWGIICCWLSSIHWVPALPIPPILYFFLVTILFSLTPPPIQKNRFNFHFSNQFLSTFIVIPHLNLSKKSVWYPNLPLMIISLITIYLKRILMYIISSKNSNIIRQVGKLLISINTPSAQTTRPYKGCPIQIKFI